jgi:hypothetical protein
VTKYVNYHVLYLDRLKWKEQVKVPCDKLNTMPGMSFRALEV